MKISVYIYDSSDPVINGQNIIRHNKYGLYLSPSTQSNTLPAPLVNNNSIYENWSYNYYAVSNAYNNASAIDLDAENNWWGKKTILGVSASLLDRNSTSYNYYPAIDFVPFLDGPGGSALNPQNMMQGDITSDVFVANTEYYITGDITIPSGSSINIPEGVHLYFVEGSQFNVYGNLSASGTQSNPVVFSGEGPYVNAGMWSGIIGNPGSSINVDYAFVEFADTGIYLDQSNGSQITNSVIRAFLNNGVSYSSVSSGFLQNNIIGGQSGYSVGQGYGVSLNQSTIDINGNIIQYNIHGINVFSSDPSITGNYIHNSTEAGVYIEGANSDAFIQNNVLADNHYGIVIIGVGYLGDSYASQPVINGNDIYGSIVSELAVRNYESSTGIVIDMTNNYWGTTTPTLDSTGSPTILNVNNQAPLSLFDYQPYSETSLNTPLMLPGIASNNHTISDVSITPLSFNPRAGEVVSIGFSLPLPTTVNIRIISERDGSVIFQDSISYLTAGPKVFTWNGRNDIGDIVKADAYLLELIDVGGRAEADFKGVTQATITYSISPVPEYDVYRNEHWKHYVTVDRNIRLKLCISGVDSPVIAACRDSNAEDILIEKVLEAGSHWIYWDGRDKEGRPALITADNVMYQYGPRQFSLPGNAIIVEDGAPKIVRPGSTAPDIEIKSNPYAIHHSYDEFTSIGFQIDQNSYVTVKLVPPSAIGVESNEIITLPEYSNVLLAAEQSPGVPNIHVIEWDGHDDINTNVINIKEEGSYMFMIEATSESSGITSVYRGSLTLYR